MQIRVLPVQAVSGEVIDRLRAIGVRLDESRILRIDLAWEMYFGRGYTWEQGAVHLRLPAGGGLRNACRLFVKWMQSALSGSTDVIARSLHHEQASVLVLLPNCTPEVEELILRQLSFYSETVERISKWDGMTDPLQLDSVVDAWVPPVIPANGDTDLLRHQTSGNANETVTLYQAMLGIDNVYVQKYTLQPGAVYSRHHSHSTVDEIYLVLEGSCKFRIGSREQVVNTGDLVTKPKGIGLATQVYNHSGRTVTILDIEIWGDMEATDLCIYPDHAEILLRGKGWAHQVPLDAVDTDNDLRIHYDTGYRRLRNGSFVPQVLPGVPTRKER
ncbi:cupin domain-containing protein [Effusibacillus pohliae]|uniref:cupin domain-containing protein n=1 Tax=Effusibacillus pohliae TaxID=232270 RepID=UPI0003694979|nr:cupin domain-containing protein [Effusibacillus pohliae]